MKKYVAPSIKITVFSKKIPVNFILDSRSTLQVAFICAISLQYLNSIKITSFSGFYRFFKKNTG